LEITRFQQWLSSWYACVTNDTICYTKDMMNKLSLSWLILVS
jgi:hypothetical protein